MSVIAQGENFILSIAVNDDSDNPIPATDISGVEIEARDATDTVLRTWKSSSTKNIQITDGQIQLEVAAEITKKWLGDIEFKVYPSFTDPDYFVTGAQTDAVCFDSLLTVVECLPDESS